MRIPLIATLLAVATLSGCAQTQPQSNSQSPAPQPTQQSTPQASDGAPSSEGLPPAVVSDAPSAARSNAGAADAGKVPPGAQPAAPKASASTERPKPVPTPPNPARASAAAPPPATTSPPAQPSPPIAPATPVQPPAAPTLDLASMTQRLRDTNAIGVFTKLSLKNQVDDLLEQFRGFYNGQVKVPLPELRQRYELLLLKVVSLLQDADPTLANAITSSREAIWNILADPREFAKI
jgi:hypothetical protein